MLAGVSLEGVYASASCIISFVMRDLVPLFSVFGTSDFPHFDAFDLQQLNITIWNFFGLVDGIHDSSFSDFIAYAPLPLPRTLRPEKRLDGVSKHANEPSNLLSTFDFLLAS